MRRIVIASVLFLLLGFVAGVAFMNLQGRKAKEAPAEVASSSSEIGSVPDTLTLRVFFGNSVENPNAEDCRLTYPVERTVARRPDVARAALEELLKGPTRAEKDAGYHTSLPENVGLVRLTIADGAARAEFDDALERGVGGSCRVAAIRGQIESTLKQFPAVREVVISVNGRVEDVLQP